jgi:hypothetical protein
MSAIQTPKEIKSVLNNLKPGNVKRKNTNSGYDKHTILLKYDSMETNVSEQPAVSSSGSMQFKSEHNEITEYYNLNCKRLYYKHPNKYISFKKLMNWKRNCVKQTLAANCEICSSNEN